MAVLAEKPGPKYTIPQVQGDDPEELLRKLNEFAQEVVRDATSSGPVTAAVTPPQKRRGRPARKESTMTPQPMTAGASASNRPTLADLEKDVSTLGEASAKASDAQIQSVLKVFQAGYLGSIDLEKNKHGDGVDDARKLADAYIDGRRKTVVFDAKSDTAKTLASDFRTAIRFGGWTKGGVGQPLQVANDFMTMRQNMRKDPTVSKQLKDARQAFVGFARAQMKRDSVIAQGEFRQFMLKPAQEAQTEEGFLDNLRKQTLKHEQGKGGFSLDGETAKSIRQAISKRLAGIAKAAKPTPQAA